MLKIKNQKKLDTNKFFNKIGYILKSDITFNTMDKLDKIYIEHKNKTILW